MDNLKSYIISQKSTSVSCVTYTLKNSTIEFLRYVFSLLKMRKEIFCYCTWDVRNNLNHKFVQTNDFRERTVSK